MGRGAGLVCIGVVGFLEYSDVEFGLLDEFAELYLLG